MTDRKKIRHAVRHALDKTAEKTGIMKLFLTGMKRGLTVLMYHRILPVELCLDYPLESLVIPAELFRMQMSWLSENASVIPLNDAIRHLNSGGKRQKPLVAVTFDDGYNDNYKFAAPALEEFGLRGTFFATTGFIRDGKEQWYDTAAAAWKNASVSARHELATMLDKTAADIPDYDIKKWMEGLKRTSPEKRTKILCEAVHISGPADGSLFLPMTPGEIADLRLRGHEIGSHSVTHPIMPQLNGEDLRSEVGDSAAYLRSLLAVPRIEGFCYPNGDFDGRTEAALVNAGYEYACTTVEGLNLPGCNPLQLKRLPVTLNRTAGGITDFIAEICRFRALMR